MHIRFLIPAVLLGLAGVSQGAIIFSDNFDSNIGQSSIASGAVDSSATGTFDVTSGNVDVVGPGFFPFLCVAPESGSCVDMDGSAPGQITSTSISLVPGDYTLSFDINGTQRGPNTTAQVTFGAFYNHTFSLASSDVNAITTTFDVFSATAAQIVFTSLDPGGDEGALVDNVTVTQNSVTGGTPEPASIILTAGAAVLALARRRRAVR